MYLVPRAEQTHTLPLCLANLLSSCWVKKKCWGIRFNYRLLLFSFFLLLCLKHAVFFLSHFSSLLSKTCFFFFTSAFRILLYQHLSFTPCFLPRYLIPALPFSFPSQVFFLSSSVFLSILHPILFHHSFLIPSSTRTLLLFSSIFLLPASINLPLPPSPNTCPSFLRCSLLLHYSTP